MTLLKITISFAILFLTIDAHHSNLTICTLQLLIYDMEVFHATLSDLRFEENTQNLVTGSLKILAMDHLLIACELSFHCVTAVSGLVGSNIVML